MCVRKWLLVSSNLIWGSCKWLNDIKGGSRSPDDEKMKIPTSITTLFIHLVQTSCTVQVDTNYNGYDVNNGHHDHEILYLGSCQSFCESKYPATTHYSYGTSRNSNVNIQNKCFCKSSNAAVGHWTGVIAGDTSCAGNKREICCLSERQALGLIT